MNKRARTRIIGVTVIIIIVVGAIIASMASSGNGVAASLTVKQAATDTKLVGKQVKVSGLVVAGSYDVNKRPMEFDIRDEADKDGKGPTLHIVYDGQVPSAFGDGVKAIVTGELDENKTVTSSQMITQCPSKYSSVEGALTPKKLNASKDTLVGTTVKLAGKIVEGSLKPSGAGDRFLVESEGEQIAVVYSGALSADIKDGSPVVVTGKLTAEGKFEAAEVALEKNIKE